jgi:hypothetical protein
MLILFIIRFSPIDYFLNIIDMIINDAGYLILDAGWSACALHADRSGTEIPACGRQAAFAGMIKFLYPVSSIYFNNTLKFLYN